MRLRTIISGLLLMAVLGVTPALYFLTADGASTKPRPADIPVTGDTMQVLKVDDTALFAWDMTKGVRTESDGAKSVVTYALFASKEKGKPPTAHAGRLAVRCMEQTFRVVDVYVLDEHGKVLDGADTTDDKYSAIDVGSAAAELYGIVCEHPLAPQIES